MQSINTCWRKLLGPLVWLVWLLGGPSHAGTVPVPGQFEVESSFIHLAASCKSYRNCEQAVRNWCNGSHRRADGDGDGIPCENVCKSRSQVRDIQQKIGCDR